LFGAPSLIQVEIVVICVEVNAGPLGGMRLPEPPTLAWVLLTLW
jgi:hypothetical protein